MGAVFHVRRVKVSVKGKLPMRLSDWVFAFVHQFRYDAGKLAPWETKCFEPYVKEQMLTKPCQVEVMQFSKPYHLALVFFFDENKRDLLIEVRHEEWRNSDATLNRFLKKYSELNVNRGELHGLLERCRNSSSDLVYSVDFISKVNCICFMHDVRIKTSPFPWSLYYISNPQQMAETIFNLNHCQAQDAFFRKTLSHCGQKRSL